MKILFVHAGAEFSIADVSYGYREAFARAGHAVRDYNIVKRMNYHAAAIGAGRIDPEKDVPITAIAQAASETMLIEAIYHKADLVVIVCGLNVHPVALQLLRHGQFPVAVILTESPYENIAEAEWLGHYPEASVFTNDSASARLFGWHYLPPAYDVNRHRPHEPNADDACDVLFIGTGWPNRVEMFNRVDWTGIRFRWLGPLVGDATLSPSVAALHEPVCVTNALAAKLYGSASICINLHRESPIAESPNPRVYELAACGAFQICDEGRRLPAGTVTFDGTARDLEDKIRYYLAHPEERAHASAQARASVGADTFDHRVASLLSRIAPA